MRIDGSFKLRKIAGENLIVKQGGSHSDLTKIISLNPTAVFLWESLEGKDFTVEDAARLLVDRFGIDKDIAMKDADRWIGTMTGEGIIG